MSPIYLASASPRRRELLTLLPLAFECLTVDVAEQLQQDEKASDYVTRLAQDKAKAGVTVAAQNYPVLGSDTVVVLDGRVLEKPRDEKHAAEMLSMLSGRQHQVMTGIAFADREHCLSHRVVTDVLFRELTPEDILTYIASGEPMDKAGAYGIQGLGGSFVRSIQGSYHAVVGLPLVETKELLDAFIALREVKGGA